MLPEVKIMDIFVGRWEVIGGEAPPHSVNVLFLDVGAGYRGVLTW